MTESGVVIVVEDAENDSDVEDDDLDSYTEVGGASAVSSSDKKSRADMLSDIYRWVVASVTSTGGL